MTTHATTRPPLAPAPTDPDFVDWVLVARVVGVFTGPVHRKLTPAEIEDAIARGMTFTKISQRLEVSTTQLRRMATRPTEAAA